jgi:outer membrane protein TolC
MRKSSNPVAGRPILIALIAAGMLAPAPVARAQQPQNAPAQTPSTSPAPRVQLTLKDAIARARRQEVTYNAVQTDALLAREDRAQARDALLPSVTYNNEALYTQSAGAAAQAAGTPVRFIANNAVHEYISQGNVHETIGLAEFASYRRSAAIAAAAKARAEVAARGLVVTVVQAYFAAEAAAQKLAAAQRAADEGKRFLKISQDLENGGEVAHSDVIKAQLQTEDRNRQLQEAQLADLNARLNLAVLVFPNFSDNFDLTDDLHADVPLLPQDQFEQLAGRNNPDVRAAVETLRASQQDVLAERAGYLPSLGFDYFYGIDATHFATKTNGIPNLGSSVMATVNIPIWNWGATQSRVRQAELRRAQSRRELSFAQRKLAAEIRSLYSEAQTARQELAGLSRAADLAAESLRLTTLRYQNGESTVLEVVDAQNTNALANAAYQDGAVRYRVALASLQTLTGVQSAP